MSQLIRHERIETTVPRAKELRKVADRMITLGKEVQYCESPLHFAEFNIQDRSRAGGCELATASCAGILALACMPHVSRVPVWTVGLCRHCVAPYPYSLTSFKDCSAGDAARKEAGSCCGAREGRAAEALSADGRQV